MENQDKEDIKKARESAIRKYYDWYCNNVEYIPYEIFLKEHAPKDH